MRVLFTNNSLRNRAGGETFVRDLTVALARRGHGVAVYTPALGEVADELRESDVFVCERLSDMPWRPDIIHGHHHAELMTALLFYRRTPAIFVSHGWIPWDDVPPRHPRIMQYFAVDVPTREAATRQHAIAADRIRVFPNFVDLERFKPRPPLPPKPKRALVLSNYANERTHLPVVREACARAGIVVDVRGCGVGRVAKRPEELLPRYDVVFAKGRAALEAVAVGNAVIVCDMFGVGPMISPANARQLRTLAGDFRKLAVPLSVEAITRQLAHYSPAESARLCRLARARVGLGRAVRAFEQAYEESTRLFEATAPDENAEAAAESAYLASLARHVRENPPALPPLATHIRHLLRARWPSLEPSMSTVARWRRALRAGLSSR